MARKSIFRGDTTQELRSFIADQMWKGGGIAALIFFGIIGSLLLLRLLSVTLLPTNPNAALDTLQQGLALVTRFA